MLSSAAMSIALKTIIAGAVEGTIVVLTYSIIVAGRNVRRTFIDVRTVDAISFVTWFTRAVKGPNLVITQCIFVTFMSVRETLIYIYGKK